MSAKVLRDFTCKSFPLVAQKWAFLKWILVAFVDVGFSETR